MAIAAHLSTGSIAHGAARPMTTQNQARSCRCAPDAYCMRRARHPFDADAWYNLTRQLPACARLLAHHLTSWNTPPPPHRSQELRTRWLASGSNRVFLAFEALSWHYSAQQIAKLNAEWGLGLVLAMPTDGVPPPDICPPTSQLTHAAFAEVRPKISRSYTETAQLPVARASRAACRVAKQLARQPGW